MLTGCPIVNASWENDKPHLMHRGNLRPPLCVYILCLLKKHHSCKKGCTRSHEYSLQMCHSMPTHSSFGSVDVAETYLHVVNCWLCSERLSKQLFVSAVRIRTNGAQWKARWHWLSITPGKENYIIFVSGATAARDTVFTTAQWEEVAKNSSNMKISC